MCITLLLNIEAALTGAALLPSDKNDNYACGFPVTGRHGCLPGWNHQWREWYPGIVSSFHSCPSPSLLSPINMNMSSPTGFLEQYGACHQAHTHRSNATLLKGYLETRCRIAGSQTLTGELKMWHGNVRVQYHFWNIERFDLIISTGPTYTYPVCPPIHYWL